MQSNTPPSTSAPSGPPTPAPPSQTVGGIPSKSGVNIIRPGQQTSYHVPRGAAAVASIAMPRPSLATVRSGPTGSLVSIRGSTRAPSPSPQLQPQQIRTRPASSPALAGTRPMTPQRSDAPRPSLNTGMEKAFTKNPIPLAQGQGRPAPLVGQSRVAAPPALSSQTGQTVQIVTQPLTQTVTLATSQPTSQGTVQTPVQVVTQTQPTGPSGSKPRPMSQQGVQAATVTALPTNAPAVALAAPARLASPGLIGVQTGPTRLAVATALPGTGARIVSPSGRVPARTVTYTSAHMLQAARLPGLPPAPVPVRLSHAGRVLHPVLNVAGVAPLKPGPVSVTVAAPAAAAAASAQPAGQAPGSALVAAQVPPQPGQPAAALPSLRALPAQAKVMASSVVTVAAVAGAPLRSVVAATVAGAPTTLAPVAAASSSAPVSTPAASAPASKPGIAYPQTLATVSARPVAVAGQPVRQAPGQPSVFIQTTAHRAPPAGTAGERSGPYPIQSYIYEAPSGSFQVANVAGMAGRAFTGAAPYIVQATAARPVGTTAPQQVHSVSSATAPTTSGPSVASGTTLVPAMVPAMVSPMVPAMATAVPATATAAPSGAAAAPPALQPPGPTGPTGPPGPPGQGGIAAPAAQSAAAPQPPVQPPRFNSIMVLDHTRTALPFHAVVPAEGGATGTYIAADGSLVQAVQAVAQQQGVELSSVAPTQPAQIVTQVVSQPVTSVATGHLPVQIQMVSAPVHIQMHTPAGQLAAPISQAQLHHVTGAAPTTVHSAPLAGHLTTAPQSVSLGVSHGVPHQVLAHAVHVQAALHAAPQPQPQQAGAPATPTTPSKPNASPRPSILRKRDVEGSPLKAQKNLTPLLQSMGLATAGSGPAPSAALVLPPGQHAIVLPPQSPPSPPKRPDSSGPQSSGSTTISATSSRGGSPPPGPGQSPPSAASITASLHAAGLGTEMSPRKKPRKQQLTGNELQEHKLSDEEMEFIAEGNGDDFPLHPQPQEPQQLHQQVLQQQQEQQQQQQQQQAALPPPPPAPREFTLKRPNISLLSTYRYSWKPRNNHFLRHSDVKPKDERRPSVNELASQRHIYQRLNGWKVHHLTAQMEDLADVESEVCQQLEAMLGMMERKAEQDEDKDVNRVSELIKGNMQRSRVIADQLIEAKSTVMKIFEHKPHVNDIIHRSSGKRERIFKKREKS